MASDILITPNKGSAVNNAKIEFTGATSESSTMRIEVLTNGALSFIGSSGTAGIGIDGSIAGTFGSYSSYLTMGSLVANDPGASYYAFGHRIGGTLGISQGVSIGSGGAAAPSNGLLVGGNVGIGTTSAGAKLHIKQGGDFDGSGGSLLHIGTSVITYTSDLGVMVSVSDATTAAPQKAGVVLYNNDATAGGWSPMLLFSKKESGASPYQATMAGIAAKSPLGTGNGDSWIDGELHFYTAGAATTGLAARMVIDKNGNVGIGATAPSTVLDVDINRASQTDGIRIKNSNTGGYGHELNFNLYGYAGSTVGSFDVLSMRTQYNGTTGYVTFLTKAQPQSTAVQSLFLQGDGSVGIGTSVFSVYSNFVGIQKDQSAPTRLLVNNQTNNASSSSELVVAAYGNSWVMGMGSSAKNSNALTWALDATAVTPSVKMTLNSSAGDLLLASTTAGASSVGALVVQGGISAGNTGSAASYFGGAVTVTGTLRATNGNLYTYGESGNATDGILFFNSAANNYIYGSGSQLAIYTAGVQRATISSTGATFAGAVTAAGTGAFGGSGTLGSTYLSRLSVFTVGAGNFSVGGQTNTNNTVVARMTAYNASNGNSGNDAATAFMGITSIESVVKTATSNAGGDSGGDLVFLTKGDGGTLTERMRLLSTGDVGIGTASPTYHLQVAGTGTQTSVASFRYDTGIIGEVGILSDATGGLLFARDGSGTSNTQINGKTNGDSYFNSGGNVGIGATAPGAKLEVSTGTTTNSTAVLIGPSSGTATLGDKIVLGFKLQNTAGGGTGNTYAAGIAGLQDSSGTNTGALGFYTQASAGDGTPERMRITSAGNVGIGTTNTDPLSLSRDRNLAIVTTGTNAALTLVGGGAGRIDFGVGSTRTAGIYSDATNYTEIFTTTALPLVFSTNSVQRMRITSAGLVGIGTTAPFYKIGINTSSAAGLYGNSIAWHQHNNDNPFVGISFDDTNDGLSFNANVGIAGFNRQYMFINRSTGNVGIGTTSPTGNLEIAKTASGALGANLFLRNNAAVAAGNAVQISMCANSGGDATAPTAKIVLTEASNAYSKLGFFTYAADGVVERLTIANGGDVGIGTSPSYKLDVSGSIRAGSANQTALLVTASGTATTQAAIAIQQLTGEGDTIIFADYEPYAEYGIIARNSLDSIDFTGGSNTGSLDNYNVTNRAGTTRTAYVKARIGLGSGNSFFGGNVGIGTTSTGAKLDVFQAAGPQLRIYGNAVGANDAYIDFGADNAGVDIYGRIGIDVSTGSAGVETGGLFFSTINSGTLSKKVSILGNGNFGVGKTDPTSKLFVKDSTGGNASLTYTASAIATFAGPYTSLSITGQNDSPFGLAIQTRNANESGSAYHLSINPLGGDVGIGTASLPTNKLTIVGSSNQLGIGDGTYRYDISYDNSYLRFKNSAGDTQMVVNWSTGYVGIGTTSPEAKFHVSQALNLTDIDAANQLVQLENTQTDAVGLLTGIRFRGTNATNSYNSFLGLSSTGSVATRANFIIATPNTSGNAIERLRIDSSGIATFAGAVTVSGTGTFSGSGGIVLNGATKVIYFGNPSADYLFFDGSNLITRLGSADRLTISSTGATFTGAVSDSIGDIRILPQNSRSAAYTTVLSDSGKHILHPSADTTARTITIDSNANVAYAIGTAITFINQNAAGVLTIAITSDTMRLAGAGTTGDRTLAANGVATAVKITSTEWIISGTGLT